MSSEKISSEIGQRIKSSREAAGLSQAALARQSGVPQGHISGTEAGKKTPGTDVVVRIAAALQVSAEWVLTGHDPVVGFLAQLGLEAPATAEPMTAAEVSDVTRAAVASLSARQGVPVDELPQPIVRFASSLDQAAAAAGARTEDFRAVPLVEDAVAAGAARVVSDQVEGWAWVYGPLVGRRSNLVAVRISGESMAPVLPAGSVVVVDRGDRRISPRGIYLVKSDGGVTVKRLEVDGQELVLIPENREFREARVHVAEGQETPVVGRVVWSWTSWAPPDPEDGPGKTGEKRARYARRQ